MSHIQTEKTNAPFHIKTARYNDVPGAGLEPAPPFGTAL